MTLPTKTEIGDILFLDNGAIQHPGIICDYNGKHRMAHMTEDGPVLAMNISTVKIASFRCKSQALARCAAQYARSWCFPMTSCVLPNDDDTAANGAAWTPYASHGLTGRYYGWQAHRYSGETARFEHDALYRAYKWASRLEGTLSLKKGFTCDVFVCACFHAAAINLLYDGDLGAIQAKARLLGAGRSAQKALRADRHALNKSPKSGTEYENSVLRPWSNVGPLPNQHPAILSHWMSTLCDAPRMPASLEEIFTGALLVDAKFTHGAQMKARMEADCQWWQRV